MNQCPLWVKSYPSRLASPISVQQHDPLLCSYRIIRVQTVAFLILINTYNLDLFDDVSVNFNDVKCVLRSYHIWYF